MDTQIPHLVSDILCVMSTEYLNNGRKEWHESDTAEVTKPIERQHGMDLIELGCRQTEGE